MDAVAIQQALAALTAVVQAQQQNQQQQQQAIQQQGQALQIALQAIQQNQNAVVSHPLPTFSGTVDEDVYLWLENVQRESIAGGWNEDRKRRMVNAALRDVAAAWQWQPPANVVDDWAGWSAAFRETFRKRYTFVEWETMVKSRQQLVGESAAQYALAKATLRQYCPHQMNEAEFVPYLINGIRHHQFAPVLLHSQLASVQNFIDTYSRLEAAIIHTPEIPDKHGKTIESLVAQNATLTAQVSELQKRMAFQAPLYLQPPPVRHVNWQDQRRPPGTSEDRQCYYCNQYGHMKRDCPARNQPYDYREQRHLSSRPPSQPNSRPSSPYQHGELADRTDWPRPGMSSVESQSYDSSSIRPAIIAVAVNNVEGKLNALVDPGATVNAIRRSLISHLPIEKTQTPSLKLADGTASRAPVGEIVLNICWNGHCEDVKLIVLENPSHPIILGTNWIASRGVIVSLSEDGVMVATTGGLKLSDLKRNTINTPKLYEETGNLQFVQVPRLVTDIAEFANTEQHDGNEQIVDTVDIHMGKQNVAAGLSSENFHKELPPQHLKYKQRTVMESRIEQNRKKPPQYKAGDLVRMKKTEKKTIHQPESEKKLLYIGPYRVVKGISPLAYLVEELPVSGKIRRFPAHVNQLQKIRILQEHSSGLPQKSPD